METLLKERRPVWVCCLNSWQDSFSLLDAAFQDADRWSPRVFGCQIGEKPKIYILGPFYSKEEEEEEEVNNTKKNQTCNSFRRDQITETSEDWIVEIIKVPSSDHCKCTYFMNILYGDEVSDYTLIVNLK